MKMTEIEQTKQKQKETQTNKQTNKQTKKKRKQEIVDSYLATKFGVNSSVSNQKKKTFYGWTTTRDEP